MKLYESPKPCIKYSGRRIQKSFTNCCEDEGGSDEEEFDDHSTYGTEFITQDMGAYHVIS